MKDQLRFDGARGMGALFLLYYGMISLVYDWIPSLDGTLSAHSRLRPLVVAAAMVALVGFRRWQNTRHQSEGTPA